MILITEFTRFDYNKMDIVAIAELVDKVEEMK